MAGRWRSKPSARVASLRPHHGTPSPWTVAAQTTRSRCNTAFALRFDCLRDWDTVFPCGTCKVLEATLREIGRRMKLIEGDDWSQEAIDHWDVRHCLYLVLSHCLRAFALCFHCFRG